MEQEFFTTAEAAAALGVTRPHVLYLARRAGLQLVAQRLGARRARWLLRADDVATLLRLRAEGAQRRRPVMPRRAVPGEADASRRTRLLRRRNRPF